MTPKGRQGFTEGPVLGKDLQTTKMWRAQFGRGITLSTPEPRSRKGDAIPAPAELLERPCPVNPPSVGCLWALGVLGRSCRGHCFPLFHACALFKPIQPEQSPSSASQGAFCGAFRMFFVWGEVLQSSKQRRRTTWTSPLVTQESIRELHNTVEGGNTGKTQLPAQPPPQWASPGLLCIPGMQLLFTSQPGQGCFCSRRGRGCHSDASHTSQAGLGSAHSPRGWGRACRAENPNPQPCRQSWHPAPSASAEILKYWQWMAKVCSQLHRMEGLSWNLEFN